MSQHFLTPLFAPAAVAVFGASPKPGSVGGGVLTNLRAGGFRGSVFAVNPRYSEMDGQCCYATLSEVPAVVDLAVIATPAPSVAGILEDCGNKGVRAAIVITAGFGEAGAEGRAREAELLDVARRHNIRLLGPNCLGLICPPSALNASFSRAVPGGVLPLGRLALVSQSGALCTSMLDWAVTRGLGFSALVSSGAAADIGLGDLLDYLAQDPNTDGILMYVEGVRHARRFISGLRAAARLKPVVVLKSGRHPQASAAATTHTGAIVGTDAVFDAALQRAGAVRAFSLEQLFAAGQLLCSGHRVPGSRLAILTNGGGLGVMAVDRAVDLGLDLATLDVATLGALDAVLPPQWSHGNPVDILGDADATRFARALPLILQDAGVDGVLVLLSPQGMTDTLGTAEQVAAVARDSGKPVLACWMGDAADARIHAAFAAARVPRFDSPEAAVEAFSFLASHARNQQQLRQMPAPAAPDSRADLAAARRIVAQVVAENRNMLDMLESKALLAACAIPVNPSHLCHSVGEAVQAARTLGYPVALKVHSRAISHKSDVGGVRLDLSDAKALRRAWQEVEESVARFAPGVRLEGMTVETMLQPRHGRELLIGVTRDPVFGPVISFGSGGIAVEVLKDASVALPPLNTRLARKLIDATRISAMLGEFRGMPAVPPQALVDVLRRVSELVCAVPELRALDINPLLADGSGVIAVDARVEVGPVAPDAGPHDHLAIHPWPVERIGHVQLRDGSSVLLRPIRPEDAEPGQRFVQGLSPQTRHFRFRQELVELPAGLLARFSQPDFGHELTLVATREESAGIEELLGMAAYTRDPAGNSCEFALIVTEAWQGRGLGTALLLALLRAAREGGYAEIHAEVLAENTPMLELLRYLGFDIQAHPQDSALCLVRRSLQEALPVTQGGL